MAEYRVIYVSDEVMEGRDFVLCDQGKEGVTVYLRRGVRRMSDEDNARVWEDAWAAYRGLSHVDEIPPQRVYEHSM